jgi:hypothetical protein
MEMDRESLRDLTQCLTAFSECNRLAGDFSEGAFIETFARISPFVRTFPISFSTFSLVRSRRIESSTDFENVKQMGYPPAHRVSEIGRCNFRGQPILYGSSNLETTFLEIEFDERHPCAISVQFSLKKGQSLVLLPIGEIDHYRRHGRLRMDTLGVTEQIDNLLEPLEHYPRTALQFVDAYLADYFRREPNGSTQRNVYEVTARIANSMFDLPGVDGLIFPSIRHEGGINYALKPEAFDSKLEITKFLATTPVHHNGYGLFDFYVHEEGTRLDDDGNFVWQRDPRYNARATMPLSAEQ